MRSFNNFFSLLNTVYSGEFYRYTVQNCISIYVQLNFTETSAFSMKDHENFTNVSSPYLRPTATLKCLFDEYFL
jgi:hypothetical protein